MSTTERRPDSPPAEVDPVDLGALAAWGGRDPPQALLRWVATLMTLSVLAVVGLGVYLQTFEREEAQRQLRADIDWLERATAFHLRRLEMDLAGLAAASATPGASMTPELGREERLMRAGALLRDHHAVPIHGWLDQTHPTGLVGRALDADRLTHPDNEAALDAMLATARAFGRPAYAGPMLDGAGRAGTRLWLAVPHAPQGRHQGSYLATIELDAALAAMVPAWFRSDYTLGPWLGEGGAEVSAADRGMAGRAVLALPGSPLALGITPLAARVPWLPRIFLAVAVALWLGLLAALFALGRGIRARHRAERLLAAQVALRRAMEDALTTGLRAWDTSGRILYVNRAFCELVGYSAAELIGRRAPMPYWPPERVEELAAIHATLMRDGTGAEGIELQFRHRSGRPIEVLIHEAPLYDAQGRRIGWMGSVVDITERRRRERMDAQRHQRLEAMGRLVAVGEAASTLAHELNQPLGALSSFANGLLNRLRQQPLPHDEVVAVVERLQRLAHKAGRILQRVHAFARRRDVERQALELRAYVAAVVRPLLRRTDITWQLTLEGPPLWVSADAALLEHALRNLVDNAADWAARGGAPRPTVRIELVSSIDAVGVIVADNGPGVPDELRDDIFNAFYSLKEGGMGMGLAICRSIVEAHHGRIAVERDIALAGARFTVWLPCLTDASRQQECEHGRHGASGR